MTTSSPSLTGRAVALPDNQFIVSKTDPQGRITYANRVFMEVSGYSEDDLLGQPHSMIRHPAMPRGVFRLMWDTLKAEREFFGYVCNRCANGDHYWVFAHVVAERDAHGHVVGYSSFRRAVRPQAIAAIEPIYAAMRAVEARSAADQAPTASLRHLLDTLESRDKEYLPWMFELAGL